MKTLLTARVLIPTALVVGLGIVLVARPFESSSKPARPEGSDETATTQHVQAATKQRPRPDKAGPDPRRVSVPDPQAAKQGASKPVVLAPELAELRRPVISAIRGEFSTPAEQRDAMRAALEGTGPTREPWSTQAPLVFDDWRDALPMKLAAKTKLSAPECFRAGCLVTVSFEDRETYEAAAKTLRDLPGEDARHGGRMQSPPEIRPDGQVSALWMMFRPETDAEARGDAAG